MQRINIQNKTGQQMLPTPQFTGGWSTDRQMPTQYKCLLPGNVTYNGNGKSFVDFSGSISESNVTNSFSQSVGLGLNLTDVFIGASESYRKETQETAYSTAFYFLSNLTFPSKVYNPNGFAIELLTSYGKGAYNYGLPFFREYCGDKYIQQEQLGAYLYLTIKLNFNTREETETFKEKAGIDIGQGIFKILETVETVTSKYNLQGNFSIHALQIGGNVSALTDIIDSSVINCVMSQTHDCHEAIYSITNYSQYSFQYQIAYKDGIVGENAAKVDYLYATYHSLGLNKSVSIINSNITQARDYLIELKNNTTTRIDELNHLLLPPNNPPNKAELEQYLQNAEYNLALIMDENPEYEGAIGCYLHPADCVSIEQSIIAELKPTDNTTEF